MAKPKHVAKLKRTIRVWNHVRSALL